MAHAAEVSRVLIRVIKCSAPPGRNSAQPWTSTRPMFRSPLRVSALHLITRIRTRETSAAWAMNFHPLSDKWDRLYFFMQGYSPRWDTITLLILIGCAFAARWRNREFKWNHPWPAIVAGLFLLFL